LVAISLFHLENLKHEFVVEFSVLTVWATSAPFPFFHGLSGKVAVLLIVLRHWLQRKQLVGSKGMSVMGQLNIEQD
jgi:hypothetical protein